MNADNRPVQLVLGFSPGSASDQIACAIGPALERELGRPIAIELRPGNNGADAASEVARAAPDGCTLFMATLGTHALAPHLDRNLPYDPIADFVCVSLLTTSPLVLACHDSLGVSSAAELIDLARKRPGELTYGTSAIGGAPHLAAELFQALAGVRMKHVRYAHTERLYDDLEAGRIALSFNNMMSMLPRCSGGSMRALAVTSSGRNAAAEHLPAIAESLPGYEVSNWLGIVAPKATPQPVIDGMREAIAAALRDAGVQETLRTAGVTPHGSTPDEFADFMAREIARWGPVVARFRDTDAAPATLTYGDTR
jgi:tripartite-type tricarboxylate transporter receptor subunit TctC